MAQCHRGLFRHPDQAAHQGGVFRSIIDLQGAINRYITDHNLRPKPFAWTKDLENIIAALKRGQQALDSIH
jgi:hypothetical protein